MAAKTTILLASPVKNHSPRRNSSDTREDQFANFLSLFPRYAASRTLQQLHNINNREKRSTDGLPVKISSPLQRGASASVVATNTGEKRILIVRTLACGFGGMVLLARTAESPPAGPPLSVASECSFARSHLPVSPQASSSLPPRAVVEPFISPSYIFFAVKFISLDGAPVHRIQAALREAQLLHSCCFFSILKHYNSYVCLRRDDVIETVNSEQVTSVDHSIAAVMMELEYANSGDLRMELNTRVRRQPQVYFSQREVLLIFLQVVMALHYLHSRQRIIHRDVKTSNIFLCSNGLVKLGDFGLSKRCGDGVDAYEPQQGSICGTVRYIAPEVRHKQPYGAKADMFSLGVVLYELMTLEKLELRRPGWPLEDPVELPPPPPIDHYDGEIGALALRLMHPQPAERPTALEVLATPLLRQAMGVLLDVIYREPVPRPPLNTAAAVATVMDDTATSTSGSSAATAASCTERSTGDDAASTVGVAQGSLNISAETRDSILKDLDLVMRDVVAFLAAPDSGSKAAPPRHDELAALELIDAPLTSPHPMRVLASSLLVEEQNGKLKQRYLELVKVHPSASFLTDDPIAAAASASHEKGSQSCFELWMSVAAPSPQQDNRKVTRSLDQFVDCCPTSQPPYVGFSLLLSNGTEVQCVTASEAERDVWCRVLLRCLHIARPPMV